MIDPRALERVVAEYEARMAALRQERDALRAELTRLRGERDEVERHAAWIARSPGDPSEQREQRERDAATCPKGKDEGKLFCMCPGVQFEEGEARGRQLETYWRDGAQWCVGCNRPVTTQSPFMSKDRR